jgi:hypothetical protein
MRRAAKSLSNLASGIPNLLRVNATITLVVSGGRGAESNELEKNEMLLSSAAAAPVSLLQSTPRARI